MLIISSAQNDTFRKLLSLTTSKGLKEEKLFLLSGEKLIREFLVKPNLEIVYEVVVAQSGIVGEAVSSTVDEKIVCLTPELFNELDILGTHFNILVLKQPRMGTISADELYDYQPLGMEIVIPVGDPGNLGALIRSCEAFGINRAILTREAAHPFLPKAVKASAGSVLRVSMIRAPGLAAFSSTCIALDAEGMSIHEFNWPANGMLVVGEEGPGLSEGSFKTKVSIPTQGVESLNAVVAASIALSFLSARKHK